jgi:hypothetical protein
MDFSCYMQVHINLKAKLWLYENYKINTRIKQAQELNSIGT